jgi:hypothetical protein
VTIFTWPLPNKASFVGSGRRFALLAIVIGAGNQALIATAIE